MYLEDLSLFILSLDLKQNDMFKAVIKVIPVKRSLQLRFAKRQFPSYAKFAYRSVKCQTLN